MSVFLRVCLHVDVASVHLHLCLLDTDHGIFTRVSTVHACSQIKFNEMFIMIETQFSYRLKCYIPAPYVFLKI